MKRASIRDFRANLAELIDAEEPVVVTRHGSAAAIFYPMANVRQVPIELRREIADAAARDLGLGDEDPVVDEYKRDVDRSLIRENLRRSPEERIRSLQQMQRLREELRRR